MGILSRRQLSTTEKMGAILGPASLLPRCSQLRLSMAIPQTFCPCRSGIRDSLSLASALRAEGSLSR
jgi:hypothetical protein